jgi:hypothetical protein
MSVQAGLAGVTAFLERHGVPYEGVEHERTQTAAAEPRAAGVPAADVAKTVVLRDDRGLRLAVIPASDGPSGSPTIGMKWSNTESQS